MEDRWPYPIPMTMQRQAGCAPKPRPVKSPPVAPAAEADKAVLVGKAEAAQITVAPEL